MNILKKQSFLLLELLIALILFSSCILPLARIPANGLASEIKTYQKLQLHRYSDLKFADIKALLYQNEVPWDLIDCVKQNKSLLSQDKISIHSRLFERSCYIWISSQKRGENQETYALAHIEIQFSTPTHPKFFFFKNKFKNKKTFHYQVFIEKKSYV